MPDFKVELLEPSDVRWLDALSRIPHDIYMLPEWCRVHESMDGGSAKAILVQSSDDILLIPVIQRQLSAGLWDATSPYGYAGYLSSRSDDRFLNDALRAVRLQIGVEGCVSLFLRLHPVLNQQQVSEADATVTHGPTVIVNLEQSHGEWWQSVRKSHRYEISRAQRAGMIIRTTQDVSDFNTFAGLYRETLERLSASSYYLAPTTYFYDLLTKFEGKIQLWVAEVDKTIVAGSMFALAESAQIAQYMYSATATEFRSLQPSKAILAAFIQHALRARSAAVLHLGGGVGAGRDGLLDFKMGFSGSTLDFRSARFVIRPEEFRSLTEYHLGKPSAQVFSDCSGFFPNYRQPKNS